jgi:hypothetical protein
MIADGTSSPADLMILPLLFVVTFMAVSAVFAVWRRLTARGRGPEDAAERPPLGVPAAVGHLRAAGIDADALLGPWLMEERREDLMAQVGQARAEETTLEFS